MRRRWLLKWEVRATFLKNWTTACLSVDGTETIEGTIDAIWEETTSELISLSEEWTWSPASEEVALDGSTDLIIQGGKAECVG